tara:strand:+ start:72 stop:236 length:165 start_codon:yes stop_codon:yes gene_type:complete
LKLAFSNEICGNDKPGAKQRNSEARQDAVQKRENTRPKIREYIREQGKDTRKEG